MTTVELLLVRLAPSMTRALFKSWAGDKELLLDTSSSLVDLFGQAGLGQWERRKAAREFDAAGEDVARRLDQFFQNEQPGGLPENEAAAAIDAVADTFDRGFTSAAVAFEVNMDPVLLEQRLRAEAGPVLRAAMLSDLAERLFDFTLRQSCAYLVQMISELSSFGPSALIELLQSTARLETMLRDALAALPEPESVRAQDFTTSYRQAVARRLDWVDLLGLKASRSSRRYALSIAYVGLRADVDHEVLYDEEGPEHLVAADEPERVRRADELTSEYPWLVISGGAGSGKTTILQWLAVRAATRTFAGPLTELNGLVPFYVRLRRYAGEPLPRPSQLIGDLAEPIADLMPTGWAEGLLRDGSALVLIDGIDELPGGQREAVETWLHDLCASFPEARFVVSTRPAALDDWLAPEGFETAHLQPMSLRDCDQFVDHWYAAAAQGEAGAAAQVELTDMARAVKAALRDQGPIRRLASNPLLCAVICAVHRDGTEVVPQSRVALYETALGLLLDKRDAARGIATAEIPLTGDQLRLVVEDLAWWMVLNDQADADREEVEERVSAVVERMDVVVEAVAVVAHLIDRAGLLREPASGRVDFVHKSFLEYLAARVAVSRNDLGVIAKHAHEITYQEVVVLAAAMAAPRRRDSLVQELVRRSREEPDFEHRLVLIAAQCVDVAPDLGQSVRQLVDRQLSAMLPPRTLTVAEALAGAGDVAVSMLPYRPTLSAEQARACVRTLALIGSPAALSQLRGYGVDHRLSVVRELVASWGFFDQDEFARDVMRESPLVHGGLTVTSPESLRFVGQLRHLRALNVQGAMTLDVMGLTGAGSLEELTLQPAHGLQDLTALEALKNLRSLRLVGAPDLDTLAGLEALELERLTIERANELTSLDGLARARPTLRKLELRNTGASNLDALAGQHGLFELKMAASFIESLAPIADLPLLEELHLSAGNDELELHWLSLIPALRSLTLDGCPGSFSVAELPTGSGLGVAEIRVHHCPQIETAADLRFCLGASSLTLSGLGIKTLEGIAEAIGPQLTRLEIDDCPITSLRDVPPSVTSLKLVNLDVRDARPLSQLPGLTELELDQLPIPGFRSLSSCTSLTRLVLGDLPNAERVHGLRHVTSLLSIAPGPLRHRVEALSLGAEIEPEAARLVSPVDALVLDLSR